MANGMFAPPIAGIMKDRRWRRRAAKRSIVAHISPDPPRIGLGLGQNRHRRIIAVQSLGGKDMCLDQQVKRHQCRSAGANLIGQGREAEIYTLAGIAVALAIEWLMCAKLLEQHHRQEAGTKQPPGCHMEWRGWLRDRLTIPAGELLPDSLDHLPLARHDLECLGDILAQLAQPIRPATGTGAGCGDDDPLARQMLGQRLARRPLAFERRNIGLGCGENAQRLIFAGARLALLEDQFHLIEQMTRAFGPLAIKNAAHLLVLQFQKRVTGFQISVDGLDPGDLGDNNLGRGKLLAKVLDLCLRRIRHA